MKYSAFVDEEKEPVGRGDLTLFVFDVEQDNIGNVASGVSDAGGERFLPDELRALASVYEVDRIYIGARETSLPPALIHECLSWGEQKITFETDDYVAARDASLVFAGNRRVDVVFRTEAPLTVKMRKGNGLAFLQSQPIWEDDTEVGPEDLAVRLRNKLPSRIAGGVQDSAAQRYDHVTNDPTDGA